MSDLTLWTIAIVSFVLGAFFSGSETAFIVASRIRLRHLAHNGSRRAQMVLNLLDDPKLLMSSVLIGTNLAVIGCTATFTAIMMRHFGESGASIATVILVPLVLVFNEMLPKALFLYYGSRAAINSIVPLRFFTAVLYPVVKVFSSLTEWLMRLLRLNRKERELLVTLEELLYHLEDSREAGLISDETVGLAERAVELRQVSAGQMMIPRDHIVMVADRLTLDEYGEIFSRTDFTRLPVYRGKKDTVVGILSIHNLIRAGDPRDGRLEYETPYFVEKDTSIVQMLYYMKNRGCQMALVKEGERIIGMLTLENILERLVGSIADEFH
jgi:putative hemolysin